MKATKYIIIALLAAGTTATVYAEEANPQRDGSRKAKLLERFDKNGDGELGPKEREHARQMREQMRGRFDKDGDGKLSPKERKHARKLQEKKGGGGEDGAECKKPGKGNGSEVGERGPKGRQRGESGTRGPKGRQRGGNSQGGRGQGRGNN